MNIEIDIAQRTDIAETRSVSPAYPRQCFGRSAWKWNQKLLTVKLNGNDRTFVMPEEAIEREIGVCGCHGPRKVGGLVELPHKRGYPASAH